MIGRLLRISTGVASALHGDSWNLETRQTEPGNSQWGIAFGGMGLVGCAQVDRERMNIGIIL